MIEGFSIQPDYVSAEQESELLRHVRAELIGIQQNSNGLRNRVLRWGYDYSDKHVRLRKAPDWIYPNDHLKSFESVTLNEYLPGQRIAPHIDSMKFGEPILILALNAPCKFLLHPTVGNATLSHDVQPRSLITLSGIARSDWEHSVEPIKGTATRYSIVYRWRILN